MVKQTNIYACHILGESRPWREVRAEGLWAFFRFCILMRINHLPAIELGPTTALRAGGRTHHLRQVRLHLAVPTFHRQWCARQWCALIIPTRSSLECPPCDISCCGCLPHQLSAPPGKAVDEAMLAFKGRSSMNQYVPKKPVKRGFKVCVHADSHNVTSASLSVIQGGRVPQQRLG